MNHKLPSVVNPWTVTSSLLAFFLALSILKRIGFQDPVVATAIVILVTAGVNLGLDFFSEKVHLRESTGLQWNLRNYSVKRSAIKYLGLLGTLGFISLLYMIFPEYSYDFYGGSRRLLYFGLPCWLVVAIPYIYFVDSRMKNPKDAYYEAGQLLLLKFDKSKIPMLKQHMLGWFIKAFFIPLMFSYFVSDVSYYLNTNFYNIQNFKQFFEVSVQLLFLIDVGIGTTGYIMSFRLFDTHLRSAEPTLGGWVSAIICYQPIVSIFSRYYGNYGNEAAWQSVFSDSPVLFVIWGSLILLLYVFYAWATVIFGCRFSNLTHRGIITNGPYAYLKHPAFVSKNLAWWLSALPMISSFGSLDALRRCAMLLIINSIYYWRAKTEEAHLSQDPDYVAYSKHIDEKYRQWRKAVSLVFKEHHEKARQL